MEHSGSGRQHHQHNRRRPSFTGSYPDGGFAKAPTEKVWSVYDHITRLGDAVSAPSRQTAEQQQAQVRSVADVLLPHLQEDDQREKLLQHLMKCACALPTKTPLLATLASLLTAESPAFSDSILRAINDQLIAAFQRRDYYGVKLLIRFTAELHNARVISSQVLTQLLRVLLSVVPSAPTPSKDLPAPQHILDFLASIVLTTLPLVGIPTAEDSGLWSHLEGYILRVHTPLPLSVFSDAKLEMDSLQQLWSAVSNHSAAGWPALRTVHAPWRSDTLQQLLIKNDETRHDDTQQWLAPYSESAPQLEELLLHGSSSEGSAAADIDVISGLRTETETIERQFVRGGKVALLTAPRTHLRVLPSREASNALTALERWYFDDYVADTLYFFQINAEEAAKQLLNLPYHVDNGVVPVYEDLLAEAIFGELLRLPVSPHNFVLYSVVMCKICVLFSDFPPALADVLNALFQSASSLDSQCFTKLVDWFSYHLSNFDYAWDWAEWSSVLLAETPSDLQHHQQRFVREVLLRCIRLSYYERIEKSVPPSFVQAGLLPPRPRSNNPFGQEVAPVDPRAAESQTTPNASRPVHEPTTEAQFYTLPIARQLMETVQNLDEAKLAALLDEAQQGGDNSLRAEEIIELLVRSLLIAGSKTLAHLQSALDRMLPVLFGFTYDGDDASARQGAANKSKKPEGELIVAAVWKHLYNSPQHLIIAMLKMLHAELISAKNVVDFVFRPATLSSSAHQLFPWELIDQTVRRTLERAKLVALQLLNVPAGSSDDDVVAKRQSLQAQLIRYKKKLRSLLVHCLSRFASVISSTGASDSQLKHIEGALRAMVHKYYRYMKDDVDLIAAAFDAGSMPPSSSRVTEELRLLAAHY